MARHATAIPTIAGYATYTQKHTSLYIVHTSELLHKCWKIRAKAMVGCTDKAANGCLQRTRRITKDLKNERKMRGPLYHAVNIYGANKAPSVEKAKSDRTLTPIEGWDICHPQRIRHMSICMRMYSVAFWHSNAELHI